MQADDPTQPLAPLDGGPARAFRRGDVLGRYFILHEIGRGGMGLVYEAFDPELDRKIALKILHPARAGREGGEGEIERARLLREAKALARLSHPNVIQVYDAGTVGDEVFLAMELAVGTPLDEWLREPRAWRQVLAVFQAAGRGLAAAHSVGLVHRDFKPGNVLLGDDGRVRVLDFGIARALGAPENDEPGPSARDAGSGSRVSATTPLTRAGVVLGTPRYMAPEALMGRPLDHRADQYSFCVALYEALYGIAPYPGDTLPDVLREVLAGRLREPSAKAGVPAWIRRILVRGLKTDPQQRYPAMEELLADLARDRSALRRRRVVATAAVAVLAAGGLALYRAERQRDQLCSGASAKLAGIWDAGRKATLQRAFLATGRPYAADAWSGTERALDAYTHSWAAMRTEACEATHRRGEQSPELLDLRMRCLDRRLREVRALTGLFASADPAVVEKAVPASRSLSSLDGCADAAALRAPLPPPSDPASRHAVEDLENRIAESWALWTTARYGDGLRVAGMAAEAARKLGYPPVQAEALLIRSRLEESSGQFDRAEATLFDTVAAAETGRHDVLATRAWIDLVWVVGFRQQKFAEGERWRHMAEAALGRLGGGADNPELDADLRSTAGFLLDAQGEHGRGIGLEQQALALYEKTLGPDHPSVSRTLNRIGVALYAMKRSPEALAAYQRALELTRRSLGPRHPTVAVRLGNIALVLEAQERYEESLATQLQGLAIEEQSLGRDHPRLSITHGNLSGLLVILGRYGEALEHARRAVAIDDANPDTSPADRGVSWLAVGDALFKLQRYPEALSANQKARDLFTGSLGEKHPWTAAANASYGAILFAQGRKADAVGPLRRAVSAFSAAGDETSNSGAARFLLALALWDRGGDRKEAIALARKARDIFTRTARNRKQDLPEVDAWLAAHRAGSS
jgi:tetratricopeptide (TPR) repeat protein